MQVMQPSLMAGFLCVFGKHTFPEIDLEGISKKNIVILGHSNILPKECVCVLMSGVNKDG